MSSSYTSPDAVTYRGGNDPAYWFFKGDMCIKTNTAGTETLQGSEYKITHPSAWPVLKESEFAEGHFSAVTYHDGNDAGYWFFKGNKCAKTNTAGTEWLVEPCDLTHKQAWPVLKDH